METRTQASAPIHVLMVEDETLISDWMAESLSQQGFAVQTATTAAEALEHLAADEVDVLFTDINLPGEMDGAALAVRARQMRPCLPVVYTSGHMHMLSPEARVPGAMVVPKPYEPALVGRLLAAALHDAESHRPA